MSSFAATFAPESQAEGASHVAPISIRRFSGESAMKLVLPVGTPRTSVA